MDGHLDYCSFLSTTNSAAVHRHTSITAYGRVLGDQPTSQRICAFKILIDISKFLLWILWEPTFNFFQGCTLHFYYLVFI